MRCKDDGVGFQHLAAVGVLHGPTAFAVRRDERLEPGFERDAWHIRRHVFGQGIDPVTGAAHEIIPVGLLPAGAFPTAKMRP